MIIDGSAPESIDRAVASLRGDGVIGLPTETVYGLAADALNDVAALKIFNLKGRPADHPLITHIAGQEALRHFTTEVPSFAQNLMTALWPGPLTLILKKIPGIATTCTGGASTIALRCPSHPVAKNILRRCNEIGIWGLAAPSANRFGRVSPTTAQHVFEEFGESVLVLDGGPCGVGIESTIVDCTRGAPIVLRPGILTLDQISKAAKCAVQQADKISFEGAASQSAAPKASGTLESHYAPNAVVRLLSSDEILDRLQKITATGLTIGVWAQSRPILSEVSQNFLFKPMPNSPQECAKALFAQLRGFDSLGMTEIWVQEPPQTPEWAGITDRLQRAAHRGSEPR